MWCSSCAATLKATQITIYKCNLYLNKHNEEMLFQFHIDHRRRGRAFCSSAVRGGVSPSVRMIELTWSVVVRVCVAGYMVPQCKLLRSAVLLKHLKSHLSLLSRVQSQEAYWYLHRMKKFWSSLQAFWLCRKLRIAEKVLTQVIFILSGYIFLLFNKKTEKT